MVFLVEAGSIVLFYGGLGLLLEAVARRKARQA